MIGSVEHELQSPTSTWPQNVGAAPESSLSADIELARWRSAGHMARFGHWLWTADRPGGWDNGHSEYSREAAAILGRDPAELTMGTADFCDRIVHPDDGERVRQFCAEMNARGDKNYAIEYRILQPDGEVREVLEFAENSYDNEGRIVATAGTLQDVTERNRIADQLREAQRLDAVVRIAGGVAHDFNNLLAVILGNAELLEEQLKKLGLPPLRTAMIMAAAQRGASLADKLLAFAGRRALVPERIDIGELIADMTPQLERSAGTGIELRVTIAPGLWPVSIDPVRLEAALLNIVVNAREAMASGGVIQIEAANVDPGPPGPGGLAIAAGERVMISVVDSGHGMPPEIAARAIDPFFTTRELGRGLGLSMAYGFVKQSGGKMEIDSAAGKGTAVRLHLPRAGERPMFGARLLH